MQSPLINLLNMGIIKDAVSSSGKEEGGDLFGKIIEQVKHALDDKDGAQGVSVGAAFITEPVRANAATPLANVASILLSAKPVTVLPEDAVDEDGKPLHDITLPEIIHQGALENGHLPEEILAKLLNHLTPNALSHATPHAQFGTVLENVAAAADTRSQKDQDNGILAELLMKDDSVQGGELDDSVAGGNLLDALSDAVADPVQIPVILPVVQVAIAAPVEGEIIAGGPRIEADAPADPLPMLRHPAPGMPVNPAEAQDNVAPGQDGAATPVAVQDLQAALAESEETVVLPQPLSVLKKPVADSSNIPVVDGEDESADSVKSESRRADIATRIHEHLKQVGEHVGENIAKAVSHAGEKFGGNPAMDAMEQAGKPALEAFNPVQSASGAPAMPASSTHANDNSAFARLLQGGHPPVAEQVMVRIKHALKEGGSDITIYLDPAELGSVDVRMHVTADGKATLVIVADNKDALAALQQDARHLERALQGAGLKMDDNSLSFNLRGEQHGDGRFASRTRQNYGGPDEAPDEASVLAAGAQEYRVALINGLDIKV